MKTECAAEEIYALDELRSRLDDSSGWLAEKSREFDVSSIVKISELFPSSLFEVLEKEAARLVDNHGVRREFSMEATDGTPRRMTNVAQSLIELHSPVIENLYRDPLLRKAICAIVGRPILDCPYAPERYIITKLHRLGDTHGWHWDDYSIAVVWILRAPPMEAGGILQCVPRTEWNKHHPRIVSQFVKLPIWSFHFTSGDVYIMSSRTVLHRVYPILREGVDRLILNCAYALESDLHGESTHETVEKLWR
ncbi:hypothetical protein AB3662_45570 [Sorangium cellulosum]|uniref:HalD/BesD family halogenase n=1 Tax=Sorangium cellulosum TaxID=56 RepID=UPI003D9A37A6